MAAGAASALFAAVSLGTIGRIVVGVAVVVCVALALRGVFLLRRRA